jgi:hypothetical protein
VNPGESGRHCAFASCPSGEEFSEEPAEKSRKHDLDRRIGPGEREGIPGRRALACVRGNPYASARAAPASIAAETRVPGMVQVRTLTL